MEDKVLAKVAGVEIKDSDLDVIIARYPQEQRGMFQSDMGRAQLLEQVIATELLSKFAEEKNISETEEYKRRLSEIGKQLATEIAVNELLASVNISDEDTKKFYDENPDQFNKPETVEAKHILVESKEEIDKIKEEIESSSITFEDAARKYSTCPSKDNDGNLGAFGRGMMVPEFEVAAFALEIGKVSNPVKTQFGYHLIKVEKRNEAEKMNYDEVKGQIANMLTQKGQQKVYIDKVNELQQKYTVERL